MRFLGIWLSEAKGLLGGTTIEHTLSLDRNSHEGMGLWGNGIANEMGQFHHWITKRPSVRIVKFQMQMRSCGITRITADSNELTSLDRKLISIERHIKGITPSGPLQHIFIGIGKVFQMAIDTSIPVRMINIDGITEAVFVDGQPTDISISNRENLLALNITRLNVKSSVEMPRARLTEISCENNLVVHRGNIFYFYIRIADRLGIMSATCQQ